MTLMSSVFIDVDDLRTIGRYMQHKPSSLLKNGVKEICTWPRMLLYLCRTINPLPGEIHGFSWAFFHAGVCGGINHVLADSLLV